MNDWFDPLYDSGFALLNPFMITDLTSYQDAAAIFKKEDGTADYAALMNFMRRHGQDKSMRIVSKVVELDPVFRVSLWEYPSHPNDPDYMLAHVFERYQKPNPENPNGPKLNYSRFRGILGGDNFQGVVPYLKLCCSKDISASSVYSTIKRGGERVHLIADGLGTRDRFKQLLNPNRNPGAIKFSSDDMRHVLSHVSSHGCNHNHTNQMPTVSALMPAPSTM